MFGRVVAYKYVVAAVFVSALFLDLLDVTIVNVALRTIGEEFQTEAIEWIVLGYTLSLAVWIPASGWLGDRFGTKRVFLTALALFVGGSVMCGLAQTIGQLVGFRVVQGVGGGMLTPIGVAMLFRAFPPIERARASTIVMIPTLVAPALGPVLGGLLTDTVGLAVDLLRQPAVRDRRPGLRAALPPRAHRADRRTLRRARLRAVRLRIGGDRLCAERGTAHRLDRPVGRRAGDQWDDRLRPPRVRRDPPPGADARPAAVPLPLLPGHEHRHGLRHGQLHRPDVRAPAVPPGPARPRPVGERSDDVPPGDRHPDLLADRRPHLRTRRAAPAGHRRDARRRRLHGLAPAARPRHRPVVDPRGDLRQRPGDGLHVRGRAGRQLRRDPAGRQRPGLGDLLHPAPDVGVHRDRPDGHRADQLHDADRGPVRSRARRSPATTGPSPWPPASP